MPHCPRERSPQAGYFGGCASSGAGSYDVTSPFLAPSPPSFGSPGVSPSSADNPAAGHPALLGSCKAAPPGLSSPSPSPEVGFPSSGAPVAVAHIHGATVAALAETGAEPSEHLLVPPSV